MAPPGTVSSTNLSLGKGITDPKGKSFFGSTPLKICNNTGTDGAVYVWPFIVKSTPCASSPI
jgi:hypothetical protein